MSKNFDIFNVIFSFFRYFKTKFYNETFCFWNKNQYYNERQYIVLARYLLQFSLSRHRLHRILFIFDFEKCVLINLIQVLRTLYKMSLTKTIDLILNAFKLAFENHCQVINFETQRSISSNCTSILNRLKCIFVYFYLFSQFENYFSNLLKFVYLYQALSKSIIFFFVFALRSLKMNVFSKFDIVQFSHYFKII